VRMCLLVRAPGCGQLAGRRIPPRSLNSQLNLRDFRFVKT
jgi:hypothetical protein